MAGTKTLLTAEDLLDLASKYPRAELDEGELIVMSPNSKRHSRIALRIGAALAAYAERERTGEAYGTDIGCVLHRNPDVVRQPDAAFVRAERLTGSDDDEYFDGAPDLVVEVVSPSDTVPQVRRKVKQYLKYGVRQVWLVHPDSREIEIHAPGAPICTLTASDTLTAPDLLPGFSLALSRIFEI